LHRFPQIPQSFSTCPSGSGGPHSLQVFGVRESQLSTENHRTYSSRVLDSSPRIPLDLAVHIHLLVMDDLKLLREFRTLVSSLLLCVPSAKVHAPCLDQMVVDPRHCDPTSIFTPSPEILTYFDLEYFLSARRIRPFLLLRACLLDFICTPESTISFELDLLEDFVTPHAPCISGIASKSDRRSTMIDGSQKLQGPNMCALYQRI
jgi:hypothetical protein